MRTKAPPFTHGISAQLIPDAGRQRLLRFQVRPLVIREPQQSGQSARIGSVLLQFGILRYCHTSTERHSNTCFKTCVSCTDRYLKLDTRRCFLPSSARDLGVYSLSSGAFRDSYAVFFFFFFFLSLPGLHLQNNVSWEGKYYAWSPLESAGSISNEISPFGSSSGSS